MRELTLDYHYEQKQKQKQRQLKASTAPYEQSSLKKSLWQMLNTIGPLLLLWYAALQSIDISYWLSLAFALPAAGFLVRTFIIFHDCCHYAFFKNRKANEIIGLLTGILTMHPYRNWQYYHAGHHASSGNLSKRDPEHSGEVWLMTVEEFKSATKWQRLRYRLYRHPAIMFLLGPLYLLLWSNRFNRKGARRKERLNTYVTNIGIVLITGTLYWLFGWQAVVLVQLPIFYVAGVLGIWLFYVQHTFEDSYFVREEEWEYVQAAVEGSSYYQLPKILNWLSGNIGFHHVHHLNSRIPNYHLEAAHNNIPDLKKVSTVTLLSSLQGLRFRLWDEEHRRFVSFKHAR